MKQLTRIILLAAVMLFGGWTAKAQTDYVFMYNNYILGQTAAENTDFVPNASIYTGTSGSTFRNGNGYYIVYAGNNANVNFNTSSGSNLTIRDNHLYYDNTYYLRYSGSGHVFQFRNQYYAEANVYVVTTSSHINDFSISGDATISTTGTNSSYTHTNATYYDIYSFNSSTYYSTDPSVAASNTPPTSGLPTLTTGYTWSISSNSYATVNATTGAITVNSLPANDTDITLTCSVTRNGVTQTANKTITIEAPKVDPTSISITSGNTMTAYVGNTSNITYSLTPSPCYNNVTFSSANTGVATVNGSGVVTGVAIGTTTITVTALKIDGTTSDALTETVNVTVRNKVATPVITFTPDPLDNTKATATITCSTPGTTIYYTIDDSDDPTSADLNYTTTGSFAVNENQVIKAIAIKTTDATYWDNSDVATRTYVSCSTTAPTISYVQSSGSATVTITAETGATIYYTTDGNNPTTSSANGTTTVIINSVANGTTIKAFAKNDNCQASSIVTKEIIVSGTSGSVVTLYDYEDHSWSYYSDASTPSQLHSLNPADVKITYYGNGIMMTGNADYTANSNDYVQYGNANYIGGAKVNVGGEDENTFVYYKTLERENADGTGRCPYKPIPNPFQVRPTYGSTWDGNNTATWTGWRGFQCWRLKSVTNGAVYSAASGGTALNTGAVINAETEIYFAPNSEYGMEVEFEAVWAIAYVVKANGDGANAIQAQTVGYERNFIVLHSINSNFNFGGTSGKRITNINYSATVSTYYPDGSQGANAGSTIRGAAGANMTLEANTKFENIQFNMNDANTRTLNANGHDLILGRGVTGTINYVESTSGSPASLNCMLRLESGTINRLTFLRYGGEDISGRVTIRSICGSDYDRAKGDNTNLTVSRSNSLFFDFNGAIGAVNKDVETFNLVVKSGKYQESYWGDGDDASYTHTFYCGGNSSGGTNYPGVRYVTVEGGEMGSMNGGRGVGAENTTYATPEVITFDLRVKGGLFHGSVFGSAADNPSIGSRKIVITGGEIQGWVAAGANGIGDASRTSTVNGDSYVYVGGNAIVGGPRARTVNSTRGGNVFGASRGKDQEAGINTSRVVIADNAEISNSSFPVDGGNVYGGGFSGFAKVQSNVYILGGTISNSVYGGGYGCRNANETPEANIWMTGGTVLGGVFGGNNTVGKTRNVNIYINGGTVGSPSATANVHGGGYGQTTAITGNVNIVVGTQGATSGATIYGDVYGGSALGQVNATATVTPTYDGNGYVSSATIANVAFAANTSTTVTLNAGTINGSLYGGALGSNTIAANVYGPVQVVVNGGSVNKPENNPGSVFGCNNINGSPKSTVSVTINASDPTIINGGVKHYAINGVYGGGNQAHYLPTTVVEGYPIVTINGCETSIKDVYGGGNAAGVSQTNTIVNGGDIDRVFGGGNGESGVPAHVGYANIIENSTANPYTGDGVGETHLAIHGGIINQVFGGSNAHGTIRSTMNTTIDTQSECAEQIGEFFGGGNMAPIAGNVNTTIECTDPPVNILNLYGGSNKADIGGNVTLTIKGGTFENVFGGSKGTDDIAANIGGNVILNLYGGNIGNAFGGSNVNGNIAGTITVNVDWSQNTSCGQAPEIDNIYGGSNLAQYTPTDPTITSPLVNLINGKVGRSDFHHANPGDHGRVFGGGKGSAEEGNEDKGKVTANPKVILQAPSSASTGFGKYNPSTKTGFTVLNAIYGGGEVASVAGSTAVEITNGRVGCEHEGNELLTHDNGYVFGGGKGHVNNYKLANVTGNSSVTMTGGYVHNTLFGGGQMASVGTYTYADATYVADHPTFVVGEQNSCAENTGKTTVIISGGQVGPTNVTMEADLGYVFGAGMGYYTQPNAPGYTDPSLTNQAAGYNNARFGYVNNTWVEIKPGAFIVGAVWGGSENGQVLDSCYVKVTGGQIGCGKGKDAPYTPDQWTNAINAVKNGSDITTIAGEMPECEHWPYGNPVTINGTTYNYLPYDAYIDQDIAAGTVTNIDASTAHAGDGHTFFGNVFGGGSGYYPYRITESGTPHSYWYEFQGRVRGNTRVEITGGHILTSVYGGCEYADVIGDATIEMTGGTIGLPRTVEDIQAHPVTGFLFGAGKGDQRTTFNQRTWVKNAYITVTDNAFIFGSVYGGGEDGHAKLNTQVNIDGDAWIGTWGTSYYDGNIFGGGRGFGGTALTAGSIGGNAEVNIDGNCRVLGSVYGGGRLASVGTHFVQPNDPRYGLLQGDFHGNGTIPADPTDEAFLAAHGNITVNIDGGTIGNNLEFTHPVFSTSTTYHIGDVVVYQNELWRFTAAHPAGAWNGNDVTTNVHTTGGNVFGSSMGRILDIDGASYNHLWPGLAKTRTTNVNVTGNARIYSNVYGGGELGYVMRNAKVTIDGADVEIGHVVGEGTTDVCYFGSVFGGGYGSDDNYEHENDTLSFGTTYVTGAMHAGRVYGNATVDMKNGHVMGNIYGGGELASVGPRWIHIASAYNPEDPHAYLPPYNGNEATHTYSYTISGNSTPYTHTSYGLNENYGHTKVTVSGGVVGNVTDVTVGTNRLAGHSTGRVGSVFGGGKGRPGYYQHEGSSVIDKGYYFTRMAYVDQSEVTISGGQIAASVFGGSENGHVRYDSKVTVTGGKIGIELSDLNTKVGDEYPYLEHVEYNGQGPEVYFGNVYGGGRGIEAVDEQTHRFSLTAGRVYRNTEVSITGGRVTHNVYGGGSLASVGVDSLNYTGTATVSITGGVIGYDDDTTVIHDDGTLSGGTVQNQKDFYLRAGINEGRVYGSGRGQAGLPNQDYPQMAFVKNTEVTIGGDAQVRGSVFGGGANGHVRQNTYVTIDDDGSNGLPFIGVPLQSVASWGDNEWHISPDGFISHDTLVVPTSVNPNGKMLSKDYYDSEALGGNNATFNGAHLHEHWEGDNGMGPTIYRGNVYGGGRGITPTDDQHGATPAQWEYSATAGRVYGNAHVNINGGHIFHHVYGGGSLASVGNIVGRIDGNNVYDLMGHRFTDGNIVYYWNNKEIKEADLPADEWAAFGGHFDGQFHASVPDHSDPNVADTVWSVFQTRDYAVGDPVYGTGNVSITMTGGVIGTEGITEGSLYGSGRGIAGTSTEEVTHLANSNNTVVHLQGGEVRGAVFGGGANGHVLQNAFVKITDGTVGVPLSLAERKVDEHTGHGYRVYRGNVYGGGRGVDPIEENAHLSSTAGRVYGNTKVQVLGGEVYHSVFGGGSLASVGTFDIVNEGTPENPDNKHYYIRGTGQASVTIGGGAHIGTPASVLEDASHMTDADEITAKQLLHLVDPTWIAYTQEEVNSHWNNLSDAQKQTYFIELNYHFLGSNSGMVFGSGRGVGALQNGAVDEDYMASAFTRNTIVTVNGGSVDYRPMICGSVFGGGENGHVKHSTRVDINGGIIGGIPLHHENYNVSSNGFSTSNIILNLENEDSENNAGQGTTVYRGNVYGGGRGVDHTDSESPETGYSATAGRVYGNVQVNITGGTIYHHVFGGGSLASVGTYSLDNNGFPVDDLSIKEYDTDGTTEQEIKETGDITVNVSGGQVGLHGVNEGSVFGGGRGIAGANSTMVTHLAYCNNTFVNINEGADIRGNVFGGGANGHLLHNAVVTMTGGSVGTDLSDEEKAVNAFGESNMIVYHGNVYGGGRGVDPIYSAGGNHFSYTAGRIYGNATVNISGGLVKHNVYGGGSLATVGTIYYKENASDSGHDGMGSSMVPTLYDSDGTIVDTTGIVEVNISGSAVIGDDGMNNGRVFGSCRGMAGPTFSDRAYVNNATVNIKEGQDGSDGKRYPLIHGSVFGSGENGHVHNNTYVNVSDGTIGSPLPNDYSSLSADEKAKYDYIGNVYGAGRGVDSYLDDDNHTQYSYSAGYVRGSTFVTVEGTPTIYRNVYGGGSMGLVGDYGTYGDWDFWKHDGTNATWTGNPGSANFWDNNGGSAHVTVKGTVGVEDYVAIGYGGNVYGSSRGRANNPAVSTYDFADMAYVVRTNVNIETGADVFGSVYGGGENGHVDWGGTNVDVIAGKVRGNVFGGGKGSITSPTAGIVDGPAYVRIGQEGSSEGPTILGKVFGGNDTYSSPIGTIQVDVYNTARTAAQEVTGTEFALSEVYGGGNLAHVLSGDATTDLHTAATGVNTLLNNKYITQRIKQTSPDVPAAYQPWPGIPNGVSDRKSVVYIHGCDNTIEYVYGGGNAADVIEANTTIEGGRFDWLFAGGNGAGADNPGANVGYIIGEEHLGGNASALINGGTIAHTFAGSNTKGTINGETTITLDQTPGGCALILEEIFGGGNFANIVGDVNTIIDCNPHNENVWFGSLYGGCNQANIDGDVNLTVRGGNFHNIYGGSKGTDETGADITGDVTLNIYGGRVGDETQEGNIFGGSNIKGNIDGQITVNVDYNHDGECCSIDLSHANIYGAGNLAVYNGIPIVNINNGAVLNVFGGGNGDPASTTQEPGSVTGSIVNIGDDNPNHHAVVLKNVYGGGNAAKVSGDTRIKLQQSAKVFGNVYGGGNMGKVTGDTKVIVNGVNGNE